MWIRIRLPELTASIQWCEIYSLIRDRVKARILCISRERACTAIKKLFPEFANRKQSLIKFVQLFSEEIITMKISLISLNGGINVFPQRSYLQTYDSYTVSTKQLHL